MDPVDYVDTFIAVAADRRAPAGIESPSTPDRPSIAARTYELTSGDVIFTVYADRHGIPDSERPAARDAFFAKSQACLRSSDLGKRYGWGIHSDGHGRIAVVGVETPEYADFAVGRTPTGDAVKVTAAMRSARA